MNQLLNHMDQLGATYNLSFSIQEHLQDCILGLDATRKKLLVVEGYREGRFHVFVIDLHEIRKCSLKRKYANITVGSLQERRTDRYLKDLVLQLDFKSFRPPLEISIDRNIDQHMYQLPVLEQRGRHWEALLTQQLSATLKKESLKLSENDFSLA